MRLVIVSNRLPTIVAWDDKKLELQSTAGGLVSGLSSWLTNAEKPIPYVWVGWPGSTVPKNRQEEVRKALGKKHHALPVFLSQKAMDSFYLGFCNRTIWPLFHYFTNFVRYDADSWETYREVNQTFFEALEKTIRPGDVIWIHDYHLMLLPAMLREKFPHHRIGFFLHIPFPSFETFRLLPQRWRHEMLEGLLGSDLIGFHTFDYSDHFFKCVRRMLGHEGHLGTLSVRGRTVAVDTFPMGVDYDMFHELAASEKVVEERERLQTSFRGMKIIASVDRLDYSKGVPHRLRGFGRFLEKYKEWHGKVCLAMVVVPSRIGVDHYQQMKREIDELVGDINGRYGDVGWIPIRYQYRMLEADRLTALYTISDVALVTPLRDGMNLVAKEYIASRQNGSGVLILGEMAGAAQDLGEALIVNPNDPDEIADALKNGLEMPLEAQQERNLPMQERTRQFNVHWWADDFLRRLDSVQQEHEQKALVLLDEPLQDALVEAYRNAPRRLLLLDYDGTLVPFFPQPAQAAPSEELLRVVSALATDPSTLLAIVSGRDRAMLDSWFGGMNVYLAAEHGAWTREIGRDWSTRSAFRNEWKRELKPYLESFADRLAGAYIEEKDYALVFHYRGANPQLGAHRANELMDTLAGITPNMDVQVQPGHAMVEVRNASINKGTITKRLLKRGPWDFVLAAGDDWTDEDLLRDLPPDAWSIKVGATSAHARFSVLGPADVVALLHRLI